jgi:hypothetical protein
MSKFLFSIAFSLMLVSSEAKAANEYVYGFCNIKHLTDHAEDSETRWAIYLNGNRLIVKHLDIFERGPHSVSVVKTERSFDASSEQSMLRISLSSGTYEMDLQEWNAMTFNDLLTQIGGFEPIPTSARCNIHRY